MLDQNLESPAVHLPCMIHGVLLATFHHQPTQRDLHEARNALISYNQHKKHCQTCKRLSLKGWPSPVGNAAV